MISDSVEDFLNKVQKYKNDDILYCRIQKGKEPDTYESGFILRSFYYEPDNKEEYQLRAYILRTDDFCVERILYVTDSIDDIKRMVKQSEFIDRMSVKIKDMLEKNREEI